MDRFLTWEFLGTWPGAVLVTFIITQFTKSAVDWLFSKRGRNWTGLYIPTQFLAWVWAYLFLLLSLGYRGELDLWGVPLAALNACFVALAAMKMYEAVITDVVGKRSLPTSPGGQ